MSLIFNGVTVVNGFNCFVDENDLLSKDLSKHLNRYTKLDKLHLNWRGIAQLGKLIRDTVLLRMNEGIDKRKKFKY